MVSTRRINKLTDPQTEKEIDNIYNLLSRTGFYFDVLNDRTGIGTTSPAEKLSIAGDLSITGALRNIFKDRDTCLTFSWVGGLNALGPFWRGIHFFPPDNIHDTDLVSYIYPRMAFYWGYGTTEAPTDLTFNMIAGNDTSTTPASLIIGVDSLGHTAFQTNNTERLRINSDGTIATNNPINYGADNSANDDYTVAIAGITAYTAGMKVTFKAAHANTTVCTLNINSIGAKSILKRVSTAMASNDILAGMLCVCVYDGTNFIITNPVVN